MNSNQLKEYDNLRNEINKKIELTNTLITFTIVTVDGELAFAMSSSNNTILLYLIPFFIIIPLSMRIAYYRTSIAKISAYMIVFLEESDDGLKWETRNAKVGGKIKWYERLKYDECLFLTFISSIVFALNFVSDKNYLQKFDILIIAIVISALIFEIILTTNIKSIDKERNKWIERWEKIKQ
jgi:hypothetical protein